MNMVIPLELPSVATARLPQTYEAAKQALATCAEIDECKDWADKAEAMASYARQSGDKEMRVMADRIQARALDRVGELMRQIPKESPPGRKIPPEEINLSPREQTRIAAGLSKKQASAALAINAVPRDQFEAAVESDNPPTAKKLAEMGRKKKTRQLVDLGKRKPEEFSAATSLIGLVEDFVKEAKATDAHMALRGCDNAELKRLSSSVEQALKWLKDFSRTMRGSRWRLQKVKTGTPAAISGKRSTKLSKRR